MIRTYRRRTVWQNPFFPRQLKQRWSWWRKCTVGCLLAIALVANSLILPLFAIRHIEIKNLFSTPEDLVRTAVQREIRGFERTIFLRSRDQISSVLREKFAFESVDIKIRLPQTLIILVDERRPFARWQIGDGYKIIDSMGRELAGVATGSLDLDTDSLPLFAYEVIPGEGDTPPAPPPTDLPPTERLRQAAEIFSKFKARFPAARAVIKFPGHSSAWIKVVTNEGWSAYFDLEGNSDSQLDKLSAFLAQEKIDLKAITSIDLRFADRVYVK